VELDPGTKLQRLLTTLPLHLPEPREHPTEQPHDSGRREADRADYLKWKSGLVGNVEVRESHDGYYETIDEEDNG